MGLPLPPRPPGVRCAADPRPVPDHPEELPRQPPEGAGLSSQRLPVDRLCAACRRPCLDPSQYSADEAVRLFPGSPGKSGCCPTRSTASSANPPTSARGLPPRYWLLVGTRELRKNVPWFVSACPGARPGARRAAAGAGRQPRPPARGTTRLARPARARRARRRRTARAVPPGRAALATVLRGRLRPAGGRGAERRHAGGGGQRHLAGRSHPAVGAALRPATAPPWNA